MRLVRLRQPQGTLLAGHEEDGQLFAVQGMPHVDTTGSVQVVLDRSRPLGGIAGKELAAPVTPGKIVAIGANYRDHIREAGMTEPKAPLIFAKFPSSVTGPTDPVVVDESLTERVDWEVELAVVIGRTMRNVRKEDVQSYILGYTAANDVSARDVQFGDGQWVRGKSLDTFCPLGPVLVTRDEIADPQNLVLRTWVNDDLVQNSNTREMLFGIAEILSYVSHQFTLDVGDVVLTGTPWGCGEFMTPRRSLRPGDVVSVEVEGIGRLTNPVQRPVAVAVAAE